MSVVVLNALCQISNDRNRASALAQSRQSPLMSARYLKFVVGIKLHERKITTILERPASPVLASDWPSEEHRQPANFNTFLKQDVCPTEVELDSTEDDSSTPPAFNEAVYDEPIARSDVGTDVNAEINSQKMNTTDAIDDEGSQKSSSEESYVISATVNRTITEADANVRDEGNQFMGVIFS